MSETVAFALGAVGAAIVGVGICWLAAVVERRQNRTDGNGGKS